MKRSLTIIALAGLSGACLDHELPGDESGTPASYIALQRDFASFESWPVYPLGPGMVEGHPTGNRTMYMNHTPPPHSETFPVGTMIVKSIEEGPKTDWVVHAMVKRGGRYNARGAKAWEWFELRFDANGTPVLVWRGQEPPNGERYGCLAGNCEDAPDCNECHSEARANDYVKSELLKLSDF